jgi:hypothetical protein
MFRPDMHRQKLYSKRDSFSGRFSGKEAFDITRYNQKKADALNRYRRIETAVAVDSDELLRRDRKAIMKVYIQNNYRDDKMFYTCLQMPRRSWVTLKNQVKTELGIEPQKKGVAKRADILTKGDKPPTVDDEYDFYPAPDEEDEGAESLE